MEGDRALLEKYAHVVFILASKAEQQPDTTPAATAAASAPPPPPPTHTHKHTRASARAPDPCASTGCTPHSLRTSELRRMAAARPAHAACVLTPADLTASLAGRHSESRGAARRGDVLHGASLLVSCAAGAHLEPARIPQCPCLAATRPGPRQAPRRRGHRADCSRSASAEGECQTTHRARKRR
jgi:hypothetical protein